MAELSDDEKLTKALWEKGGPLTLQEMQELFPDKNWNIISASTGVFLSKNDEIEGTYLAKMARLALSEDHEDHEQLYDLVIDLRTDFREILKLLDKGGGVISYEGTWTLNDRKTLVALLINVVAELMMHESEPQRDAKHIAMKLHKDLGLSPEKG